MTNQEAIVNQMEILLKEMKKEKGMEAHARTMENLIKTMKKDLNIDTDNSQEQMPFVYENKLYFVTPDGRIYEKNIGEIIEPSKELTELSKTVLKSCKKD